MMHIRISPAIGSPPAIQWVSVSDLSVDPRYQRSTDNRQSRRLIEAIAEAWDWRLCTPLLVSHRDGIMWVIDGQHRWEGARFRGDIPHLPASVLSGLTTEAEAAIFVAANRRRKAMTVLDDFHAAVAAGDEESVIISRLVAEAGLTMAGSTSSNAWAPGELGFTVGLRRALERHDEAVVGRALRLLGQGFSGQRLKHGGAIFAALVLLLTRGPKFEDRAIVAMLKLRTAEQWGDHPCLADVRGGQLRARMLNDQWVDDLTRMTRAPAKPVQMFVDPAPRVSRDPCPRCGVRGDIGCKHQPLEVC